MFYSLGVPCTHQVTQMESLCLLQRLNFLPVVAARLSKRWAARHDWQHQFEGRFAQCIQSETDVAFFLVLTLINCLIQFQLYCS